MVAVDLRLFVSPIAVERTAEMALAAARGIHTVFQEVRIRFCRSDVATRNPAVVIAVAGELLSI